MEKPMATDNTATQGAGESAAASAPPIDPNQPDLECLARELPKLIMWFNISLVRGDNHANAIRHIMGSMKAMEDRIATIDQQLKITTNDGAETYAPSIFVPKEGQAEEGTKSP
jgi:hypothetical protein